MHSRLALSIAGVLLTAAPLAAQGLGGASTFPSGADKASITAELDRPSYVGGDTARLDILLDIDPGWHTNSNTPTYPYLIPTVAEVALPAGWPAAELSYPEGEHQRFSFADEELSVYDGQLVIEGRLRVPEGQPLGSVPIGVSVRYQACDDRKCLPPATATTDLALAVGEAAAGAAAPDPPPAGGRGPSRGLVGFLLLGLIGGLLLNAMPCVLPVLSLKVMGLVKSAGQDRKAVVLGSLATSSGILVSFWALALAAVLARTAGATVGWGVQFQQPVFVTALTFVVVLFCLNLWGVFEVPLPRRLAGWAASTGGEGVPAHFTAGLFATLMATPCSAPFLGTAVGFALAQSPGVIFAVFTAVGVGMTLPYLALAVAPGAAELLPKPGAWMDAFRTFMGFLLAAAAIWLLYVLSSQVSRERLAFVEVSLLVLALFLWMRGRASARGKRSLVGALGAIAACVAGLFLASGAQVRDVEARGPQEVRQLIAWIPFDRIEAERLSAEGNLVFVDVTADWCFTCKVNERLVLETAEIAEAFTEAGVIAMKADWTNRDDAIAEFLADHGKYGIPFYLLYRPNQEAHLFSELLTKDAILEVLRATPAAEAASPASASR